MKWRTWYAAGAVALAVAACNGRSGTAVNEQVPATPQPTTPQDEGGAAVCKPGVVAVRLVGMNPETVSSLHLDVGSLSARAEDGDSEVALSDVATGSLDLATSGGLDVAKLTFPSGVHRIRVKLSFSGGTASLGEDAPGLLDVCTSPMWFDVDADQIAKLGCFALVILDVGHSVIATDEGLSFLPQFRVVFQEAP